MKDILYVIVLLIVVAAGFYAFQLLVLALFGLVVYFLLPYVKKFLYRRPKWK